MHFAGQWWSEGTECGHDYVDELILFKRQMVRVLDKVSWQDLLGSGRFVHTLFEACVQIVVCS